MNAVIVVTIALLRWPRLVESVMASVRLSVCASLLRAGGSVGLAIDRSRIQLLASPLSRNRLTQPCIPLGSLNRVSASAGGKGGNLISVGWQVSLYIFIEYAQCAAQNT